MERCLTWLCGLLLCGGSAALAAPLVDDRGRAVEVGPNPQRIVSLLPSLTETVCELQACGRLVGTDRYSNWPASVRSLPKLGGLEDAQIERIVALKPDLVLVATSTRAIDRLESLGLTVLALEPRSLADTRRVVGLIAAALGPAANGQALWQRIDDRIEAAASRVPPTLRGRSVYFEVASTPHAAGAASFLGELLSRLGLRNIVAESLGPFPQISPEFVVRAQPDLIMATAQNLAEMPARPGWPQLRALQSGRTCGFDADRNDALMRPGPRLGEAAEFLADCLVVIGKKVKP